MGDRDENEIESRGSLGKHWTTRSPYVSPKNAGEAGNR